MSEVEEIKIRMERLKRERKEEEKRRKLKTKIEIILNLPLFSMLAAIIAFFIMFVLFIVRVSFPEVIKIANEEFSSCVNWLLFAFIVCVFIVALTFTICSLLRTRGIKRLRSIFYRDEWSKSVFKEYYNEIKQSNLPIKLKLAQRMATTFTEFLN